MARRKKMELLAIAHPYDNHATQCRVLGLMNLEIQKRDKCAYTGPTRDCPTRGESEDLKRLRYHLTELGKFADRAGLVLATIEAEDATEAKRLQEIIDGISTWAAPAILEDVKGSNG